MLDLFIDRPNYVFQGGKFGYMNAFSSPEFLSYYYVPSKRVNIKNNCQPMVLNDELIANHVYGEFVKKTVPLMSSKEKVKQMKVRVVL